MKTRIGRHHVVSKALERFDDRDFAAAEHLGTGVGGSTFRLLVDGAPVFVKQVALTDLERAHPRQTGNLFGLPTFFQYGVGSAGFGVWRELAAHQRASDWVLTGQCTSFPLLHHWRIVTTEPQPEPPTEPQPKPLTEPQPKPPTEPPPKPPTEPPPKPPTEPQMAAIDERVAFWDGDPAVRRRLEAIGGATRSVLLALEFVPDNLSDWLTARPDQLGRTADQLSAAIAFMNSQGMVHFDAHPRNVLADERQIYITDFGLATDAGFDLDPQEIDFRERHGDFDRQNAERFLDLWSPGRWAESARKLNDFYDRLVRGPKAGVEWVG